MKQYGLILVASLIIHLTYGQKKDVSWDIKTGNEAAAKVEKGIGLVNLPPAESAVKAIGDRLVSKLASTPFEFSFHIIDQPEPNAFALPGGHVYISRGLIVLLNTEDELAGVLGHEISHVTQRHSAKRQSKAFLPTLIAAPGIIIGSTLGGSLGDKVAAPLLGAGRMLQASYSRKQETEADELGIGLAAKAGYKPTALGDILHRMELSIESEKGSAAPFSFFNDHPMTPDRMKLIMAQGSSLTGSSGNPIYTNKEFLSSYNHILFGPDPAKGIFNKNIFLHPSLKIYWELPADWTYANESTAAGAAHEESALIVTVAGKEQKFDTLINNFVNGYYARTRKQPISDSKLNMPGGRRGSEIILPAMQNNKILYTVWFRKDKMTYVIFATGDQSQTEVFRKYTMTFRDLDPADYELMSFKEMDLTTSNANETCAELSQRTGNVATVKYTAIINGISEETKLEKGYPVKIFQTKPYQPIEDKAEDK